MSTNLSHTCISCSNLKNIDYDKIGKHIVNIRRYIKTNAITCIIEKLDKEKIMIPIKKNENVYKTTIKLKDIVCSAIIKNVSFNISDEKLNHFYNNSSFYTFIVGEECVYHGDFKLNKTIIPFTFFSNLILYQDYDINIYTTSSNMIDNTLISFDIIYEEIFFDKTFNEYITNNESSIEIHFENNFFSISDSIFNVFPCHFSSDMFQLETAETNLHRFKGIFSFQNLVVDVIEVSECLLYNESEEICNKFIPFLLEENDFVMKNSKVNIHTIYYDNGIYGYVYKFNNSINGESISEIKIDLNLNCEDIKIILEKDCNIEAILSFVNCNNILIINEVTNKNHICVPYCIEKNINLVVRTKQKIKNPEILIRCVHWKDKHIFCSNKKAFINISKI